MKVYSEGEVKFKKVIRKQLDHIEYDSCHRTIVESRNYNVTDYFKVETHHLRWGNDSCESYENFDICPACINTFVANYLAGAIPTMTIEVESRCGSNYDWQDEEYINDLTENNISITDKE